MQCESRLLTSFIALRRARTLAAALLVAAIIIGALGSAVPAMRAQQAVAAPAGKLKAAPPPKAETPPPAESSAQELAHTASPALPGHRPFPASITAAFLGFIFQNRAFQEFTSERKL